MTNINNFIANFKGGSRANRFRVEITWPAAVGAPNVRDEFVVKAAGMPASVIGQIQVPYQGRQIPVPGDRTFEEWTATIIDDVGHSHRNALERWSNIINSHEGNIQEVENLSDLVSTITISRLDRSGNITKSVKILNAFPTNISQVDLGYESNDQIAEYTATFSYSHWESINSPTS